MSQRATWSWGAWWPWRALEASLALFPLKSEKSCIREKVSEQRSGPAPTMCHASAKASVDPARNAVGSSGWMVRVTVAVMVNACRG